MRSGKARSRRWPTRSRSCPAAPIPVEALFPRSSCSLLFFSASLSPGSQLRMFDLLEIVRRQIGRLRILAYLQRADIGGDRPSVLGFDAGGIRVHHAIAVGHHIEEV